jgi:hypothetical protein
MGKQSDKKLSEAVALKDVYLFQCIIQLSNSSGMRLREMRMRKKPERGKAGFGVRKWSMIGYESLMISKFSEKYPDRFISTD